LRKPDESSYERDPGARERGDVQPCVRAQLHGQHQVSLLDHLLAVEVKVGKVQ
jgi:hypothetical protein